MLSELKEQVLPDGGHFELSPMYHQILLHRILDACSLLRENPWRSEELLPFLEEKARKMLGWLRAISWKNGDIPLVNDSTQGIAPHTSDLLAYGEALNLTPEPISMRESGYRKYRRGYFELLVDAGQIGPPYQPGHAHADSLQVLMRFNGNPVLVDTGISTYEKNRRRQVERSTASHNTVTVDARDSSRVWGGFRVGKRARVRILEETPASLRAEHNGYGIPHCRSVSVSPGEITVIDETQDNPGDLNIQGHLHFPPDTVLTKSGNILDNGELVFDFSGTTSCDIVEYQYAWGFNHLQTAPKIVYGFRDRCTVRIYPLEAKTPELHVV